MTLLAATSCFGVELFIVVDGSVNSIWWCYFLSEVWKKVVPRMLKRNPGMKKEDILLVYDNCSSHTGLLSGWWMRNLPCFKLTICPYGMKWKGISMA
jgi:hypothetical protein